MIRVLVVEDVQSMHGGLLALLEREVDIEVVAELSMAPGMVPAAAELQPDVVLINTNLTASQVLPMVGELQAAEVEPSSVLILADPNNPVILPLGRRSRRPSFLIKDIPPSALVETIRRVASGDHVIDPRVALPTLIGAESVLTARELEVLSIAMEGASVREIADRLHLSVGTVRNYVSRAIAKTGARNRIDAIRIARDAGWLM
jgi:two-component system response regulator DesR